MKTILLFKPPMTPTARFGYDAIFQFATDHEWTVQTIDYINSAISCHWKDTPAPDPKVHELLDIWHPDGCIVECGGHVSEPWQEEFARVPTVFLDRSGRQHDRMAVNIASDSTAIAILAAKELISLNLGEYAYFSLHDPLLWSENRGKAFQDIIHRHGKRCRRLRMPEPDELGCFGKELDDLILSLPRPCGIFTANDIIAAPILTACLRLGFAIPEDFAFVSVDNNKEICEHLPVTLTSIEQDYSAIGLKAARILNILMHGHLPKEADCKIPVKCIVRRASASGLRNIDKRVAVAIEFIRAHACEKILPADVIRAMGCSERHANHLFSGIRRHTILDEIHLRRIDFAKEQLEARINPIETIAGLCGYNSPTDFSRVFRRYAGTSPRQWRNGETRKAN